MVTQKLEILKICLEYHKVSHHFVMVSGLLSIVNVIFRIHTPVGLPKTSFFIEKQLKIDQDLLSFVRKIVIFVRFFSRIRG